MHKKLRVGIIFGGKSTEHEISLISARNVVSAIDPDKYEVVLIGIDKKGQWHVNDAQKFLASSDNPRLVNLTETNQNVTLVTTGHQKCLVHLDASRKELPIDVMFPIMHGVYGEDGTIQGLLKLMGVPFVGASVLGSAIGMDKDVMKRLLKEAGLPIAKFICVHKHERNLYSFDDVVSKVGLPFFVKPANTGSSVGIAKVKNAQEFQASFDDAFRYDRKIIIEEFIQGREFECSVLGNERPICSLPGEVIPHHEFYSYEAKYLDEKGASFQIPADIAPSLIDRFQKLAAQAYKVLCCEGMARVDFFLTPTREMFINEINTIPGFTKISMYPKMWEASGLSYSDLIDRLIQLALERHTEETSLETSF